MIPAGGPLPRFDGFPVPPGPPPNVNPGPIQPQASGGPIRVPPLTPEKVAQYSALFEESGAQNALLAGIILVQPLTCK
jgi:epidermal growth factor receptor substrate 15